LFTVHKDITAIQLTLLKKKSREILCFLFYTALKRIRSKVKYDEPNQAFDREKSKSCPAYTLEPLLELRVVIFL